jgi:hypothetical protein
MTEKENNLDKLSKNYRALDLEGKNTLLRIGEKVLTVNDFVNQEISSSINEKDKLKIEDVNLTI